MNNNIQFLKQLCSVMCKTGDAAKINALYESGDEDGLTEMLYYALLSIDEEMKAEQERKRKCRTDAEIIEEWEQYYSCQ